MMAIPNLRVIAGGGIGVGCRLGCWVVGVVVVAGIFVFVLQLYLYCWREQRCWQMAPKPACAFEPGARVRVVSALRAPGNAAERAARVARAEPVHQRLGALLESSRLNPNRWGKHNRTPSTIGNLVNSDYLAVAELGG